jgi:hypothetical protein
MCGTDIVSEQALQADPSLAKMRELLEEAAAT